MATKVGFSLFSIGGFGTILVGLFPENSLALLHTSGAGLSFLVGNIGVLILGISLKLPKYLKIYTVLTAIIALVALVIFLSKHYFGLGEGGIERIVAYPQTLWMIIFGVYSCLYVTKKMDDS